MPEKNNVDISIKNEYYGFMKDDITYHIDVTPEEDALFRNKPKNNENEKNLPSKLFSKTFCIVLGAHVVVIASIAFATTGFASNKASEVLDIIASTSQNSTTANATVANTLTHNATTANATVVSNKTVPIQEKVAPVVSTKEIPKVVNEKWTKTYQVKPGDTIHTISKKYKLNVNKLLQINNIKDPNKIVAGQTLKFL